VVGQQHDCRIGRNPFPYVIQQDFLLGETDIGRTGLGKTRQRQRTVAYPDGQHQYRHPVTQVGLIKAEQDSLPILLGVL